MAATVLLMAGGSLAVGGLQPDVPLHLRTVADARPTPVLSAAAQGASDGNADDEDRLLRQLGRQSMINARRTAEKAARDRRAAAARRVAASRVLAARASRDHARAALAVADSYARPTSGPLTQPYGSHPGIDLAPPYGTPVVAAHAGVVAFVGEQDGYGNHVEVTLPGGYLITAPVGLLRCGGSSCPRRGAAGSGRQHGAVDRPAPALRGHAARPGAHRSCSLAHGSRHQRLSDALEA